MCSQAGTLGYTLRRAKLFARNSGNVKGDYESLASVGFFYGCQTISMERNAFSAQNQTLRSYRVYISPTK